MATLVLQFAGSAVLRLLNLLVAVAIAGAVVCFEAQEDFQAHVLRRMQVLSRKTLRRFGRAIRRLHQACAPGFSAALHTGSDVCRHTAPLVRNAMRASTLGIARIRTRKAGNSPIAPSHNAQSPALPLRLDIPALLQAAIRFSYPKTWRSITHS